MAGERKHRLRDVERIRKFRLLDDVFMKEVLRGNLAGVQDIIQTLLKRSDLEVIEVQTQDELSNLVGHGVRLDILARDSRGRYYNIEIQRSDSGAEPKRGTIQFERGRLAQIPVRRDIRRTCGDVDYLYHRNGCIGEKSPCLYD